MAPHEREPPRMTMQVLWYALNLLSGHSKPINRVPMSSYRKVEVKPTVRKISNYQPPPLTRSLGRRKVCLTPPPFDEEEEEELEEENREDGGVLVGDKDVFAQKESGLMRLPDEILAGIYERVLGGMVIHVVRRSNTLSHAVCLAERARNGEDCKFLKCRGSKLPNGVCIPDKLPQDNLLALLQVCRKIYVGAIKVLYENNIFELDCMESLISLSTSILPHRFDSIQTIHLDLRFEHSHFFAEGTPVTDYTRWERMWRIIGSMKNLKHLKARINWWRNDITGAEEARYMSEMVQVGKLQGDFVVSLPGLKWDDAKERHEEGTWEVARRPVRK